MSIQSEITRIAQNVSDSFDAVAAKGGTRPQAQNSGNLPGAILSIPAAGVQSFNGRAGDVEPQEGDYTAEMVGAQPTINVSGILKGNGAGGVSAAAAGVDFAPAELCMQYEQGQRITSAGWYRLAKISFNASVNALLGVYHSYASGSDTNLLMQITTYYKSGVGTTATISVLHYSAYTKYITDARAIKDGNNLYVDVYCNYNVNNYLNARGVLLGIPEGTLDVSQAGAPQPSTPTSGTIIGSGFEWVNPPMQLGVEYRTTERYNGKPVYKKLVDCGALVTGTLTVTHGIQNIECVISCEGCASDSTTGFNGAVRLPDIEGSSLTNNWTVYVSAATRQVIKIYCGGGIAGCKVYCLMRYTKTTD